MKKGVILDKSFNFSLDIISLYRNLSEKKEYVLSKQVLRSGTSIGANIEEATAAQSRKDFINKMTIASKEARETKYWLRLLDKSQIVERNYQPYLNEIEEIIKILTSIVKTSQEKSASSVIQNSKLKIQN
ncbi:MAG: four helix bundle protein [Cytophagaceae bacterium]